MVELSFVLWVLLALFLLTVLALTFRYIPNDRVGVVEKLWSATGSLKTGLIALNGEAGFQPELLRGGWHVLMPFQYRLHKMPLVTIPQGKIGYLFARDGSPLPPTQTLAQQRHGERFPGRWQPFCAPAASAVRNARSFAKAPMR